MDKPVTPPRPRSAGEQLAKPISCPHHGKKFTIKRYALTKQQYVEMLATPKGRKYHFELKKDLCCLSDENIKKRKRKPKPAGSPCSCGQSDDQDDCTCKSKKRRRKRKRCPAADECLKPCDEANKYLHSFLSDVWAYLTPEVIDSLKGMLICEFGMTQRQAEEFLLDQRMKTLFKGNGKQPACSPCPPPCFPCPPDCPTNQLEPNLNPLNPCALPCPPPCPVPCPPPCFPCPPLCPPPCPPPPCPCPPGLPCPCPPGPLYPCCTSPDKSVCSVDKKKKSKKSLGLRYYWSKELNNLLTIKLNDYVAMMLSTRRSKKVRYISETIVKHLADLTGEKFTIATAKTRAQKIMVFIADRMAMWLANILCSCDTQLREIAVKKRRDKLDKDEDEESEGEPKRAKRARAAAREGEEPAEEAVEEEEKTAAAGKAPKAGKKAPPPKAKEAAPKPSATPKEATAAKRAKPKPKAEPEEKEEEAAEVAEEKEVEEVETERAEDIASVISERITVTPKETLEVAKVTQIVGAWVDRVVKEAEIELVREGKPAFRVRKEPCQEAYLIRQVSPEKVCKTVVDVRNSDLVKATKSYDVRLKNQPSDEGPLKFNEIKDWAGFTAEVMNTVKEWTGWIGDTVSEAEVMLSKENKKDDEEVQKWKIDTQRHAIRWKKNKMFLKEAAQIWQEKLNKGIVPGTEKGKQSPSKKEAPKKK